MKANYTIFILFIFACLSCDDGIVDPDPGALPTADFIFQIQTNDPKSVSFASTARGANSIIWDFGDGSRSVSEAANKTYEENGTYQVSLIAINKAGVNTVTREIVIDGPNVPVADFEVGFDNVTSSLQVNLTNTSLFADAVVWDFGDGNTSTDPNISSHTYDLPGTYDILLTVRSNDERLEDEEFTRERTITILDNSFLHNMGSKTWSFKTDPIRLTYNFTLDTVDTEGNPIQRVYPLDTLVSPYHILRADTLFFEVGLEDCMLNDRYTFNSSGDYLAQNNGDGRLIEFNGQCVSLSEPGETNWQIDRDVNNEFVLVLVDSYLGDSEVGFFYRIVQLTDEFLLVEIDISSPIIGEPRTVVMAFEPV